VTITADTAEVMGEGAESPIRHQPAIRTHQRVEAGAGVLRLLAFSDGG
jgi:hypothetical protein